MRARRAQRHRAGQGARPHLRAGAEGGESAATELAIDQNFKVVWWAGALHDVGKLAVPEDILNKARALDEEEWRIVKSHADIGADLVAGVNDEFDAISNGIRTHHERWDGGGYPKGISGEIFPWRGAAWP